MPDDKKSIFADDFRRRGTATLGFAADMQHLYAYGFRRAAELLLQHVHERHTSLDVIVYPLIFLYRHHLELAIKVVARDARSLLDEATPSRSHHRLDALWEDSKRLVARALGAEQAGLEPIDHLVAQLAAVDPNSTAFRYAESIDGTPHLSGLSYVNVFAFREAIEPALDLLDAMHTGLVAEFEARHESTDARSSEV